jgi:hypothetical protein
MFLVSYVICCGGDILADFPFLAGALLADMSLLTAAKSECSTTNLSRRSRLRRKADRISPVLVCLLGLFLGSYPPDSVDQAAWSRALFQWGQTFLPSDCILENCCI